MKLEQLNPPIAKKIDYEFQIHNTKIKDEFAWLRAKNWPKKITDTKVLSYLEEENSYFKKFITPLRSLKNEFLEELKGRIKLVDQSTYIKKNNFYYYSRTEEDKDYTIYCRKKSSIGATEEILLDVNQLNKGRKFTSLEDVSISPDDKFMAYSVDFTGDEKHTIKIYDIKSAKYLKDKIKNTIGSIVWHEKLNGFFYSPISKNWHYNKIKFHKLGTSSKEDQLVLHESNPLYSVSVRDSSSKKYIFINVKGHDSNEIYYIKMSDETLTPKLLNKRKDKILYDVDHGEKYFYKSTNDGAKNFFLLRTESNNYSKNVIWDIYIKEQKNKYLFNFDITLNYLLLNYKFMGLPEAIVIDLKDGSKQNIKFSEKTYTAEIYSTNFEDNDIKINYSSLTRPSTLYNYDFKEDKLITLKIQEIPSGFNPEEYQLERIFAKTDGVEVPISLFYKKSLFKKNGSNPLYLYGYGSYGNSVPPSFRNLAISLVNRGFVYAIAHVRGGDDLGYDWYEEAKLMNKKRTFNDFIAVTEKLITDKYTSKGNIVIMGGSAGGMLIGNVINRHPELFKAAIAHVPFVDVLNTMLDENLPLTCAEFKEWGNPKDKKYFNYIKSYSPYDNVTNQNYPHLFVTAGLSDPRVGYWEVAKWVARLRNKKQDDNLLLYKTNMNFGHSGASGRFDYLKEIAEDLVFIATIFKIKN